jgi:hypothetical protein
MARQKAASAAAFAASQMAAAAAAAGISSLPANSTVQTVRGADGSNVTLVTVPAGTTVMTDTGHGLHPVARLSSAPPAATASPLPRPAANGGSGSAASACDGHALSPGAGASDDSEDPAMPLKTRSGYTGSGSVGAPTVPAGAASPSPHGLHDSQPSVLRDTFAAHAPRGSDSSEVAASAPPATPASEAANLPSLDDLRARFAALRSGLGPGQQ